MESYKLIYFNMKGRAELIRFIFAQAGVKYEDERIISEQWPELKQKMPFGVVPVVVENGKQLSGSTTIARYLGEKFGLAGANEFENAEIASIADTINDIGEEVVGVHFEKDEERKKAKIEKLKEFIPAKLGFLEKRAAGSNKGWLFNSKVTWADLLFYLSSDWILSGNKDALETFPGLKRLRTSVESLPNIAKWIEERPKTDM